MASTVFQLSLTVIVVTMATIPTCAYEILSNAVPTSLLGKDKFIVKETLTPSPYHESQNATHSTHTAEVRNDIAVQRVYNDTETVTSESTIRAAQCSFMEATDVELGALLDAGQGAMVTLVAGDMHLTAHRAVLAARSPVFAAMLCHGSQEASGGEVAIPEVEGPVMRQLLAYLYTLQAPQLPGMAPQLLAAADKFGLSALKAKCEEQVAAQLSVETAAATAVLAIRHSSTNLRQAAIGFIRAHLVQVIATQGWTDAILSHPYEVVEVNRLLAELPVETSTPATADTQPTTDAPTPPQSSQGWTRVTAVPVSQPTTKAPSQPDNNHGQTTVAVASSSPPTAPPGYDDVCRLWSLSPEEKGRRLIEAATEGRLEDVEVLLAVGADVAPRDGSGNTALDWAAYMGHVAVVRRLLQAGVEVDIRDYGQRTALHDAAWRGHTDVVRLLLASSADPNARDVNGQTALHWAAFNGDAETAAALMEAGADKGATNNDGQSPLDYARQRNMQHIVHLLT